MKTLKYRSLKGTVSKHFNHKQYDAKSIVLTWHAFLRAVEKKELHGFAVEGVHPKLQQSRFTTLDFFRPTVTSRFVPLALREFRAEAARITKPHRVEVVGDIALSKFAAPKTRQKLSLKTKVDLPVIQPVTKDSAGKDLAAVFRKEMEILARARDAGIDIAPITKNGVVVEKRRAPQQPKSWAELVNDPAESTAPAVAEKKPAHRFDTSKFDLAAAFKTEMQALLEEQARGLETLPPRPFAAAARKIA